MSIPRGDCDCCGALASVLVEIEQDYWTCPTCVDETHTCALEYDV